MSDDTPTERFDQVPEEPLPRTRPLPITPNDGPRTADAATERLGTGESLPTERLSASPFPPTEPATRPTTPAPGKASRRPPIVPLIVVAIALIAGIGFAVTLIGDNGDDPVIPPIEVSTSSPAPSESSSSSQEPSQTTAPEPTTPPKPSATPTPEPTVTATPEPSETPSPEPTVIDTPEPTVSTIPEPEPTLTTGPVEPD
jgi:hypothetical protein